MLPGGGKLVSAQETCSVSGRFDDIPGVKTVKYSPNDVITWDNKS